MKRSICLLLLAAVLTFAGGRQGFAFPAFGTTLTALNAHEMIDTGDKPGGWRRFLFGHKSEDPEPERKGAGAGFWGGPYWGYGPRWGHACETCRATCDGDSGSARCKRCQVRCGW